MRLLLDSHVALWWLEANPRLGPIAQSLITNADEVFFSAVTPWELGIKQALGKLEMPNDLVDTLEAAGFSPLAIAPRHGAVAPLPPAHHRDPFDRMLIAQAISEGLRLVSADDVMAAYDVEVVDATR